MTKRIISLLLSVAMILSLMPTNLIAYAEEVPAEDVPAEVTEETTFVEETFPEETVQEESGLAESVPEDPTEAVEETPTETLEEFEASEEGIELLAATAWTGSGTESSPYLIASEGNLQMLAQNVANGTSYSGKYFRVTGDIALTVDWIPIGTSTTAFRGVFDGNGKTISGMTVTGDYVGMFAYVGSGAVIKNVKLTDMNVSGAKYVAGLVAYADAGSGSITISNCNVSGSLAQGDDYYNDRYGAGIVAYANAQSGSITISDCTTSGSYYCDYATGGIIGYGVGTSHSLKIRNCINHAYIGAGNNADQCGGIAGSLSSAELTGCVNYGNVSGNAYSEDDGSSWLGGIAGSAGGTTFNGCANHGNVSTFFAGGITASQSGGNVAISCLNTGTLSYDSDGYGCAIIWSSNTTNFAYNCYYRSGAGGGGISGATAVGAGQLSSGEVAYALRDYFGQNIGVDTYPVPLAASNRVYKVMVVGETTGSYYVNYGETVTLPELNSCAAYYYEDAKFDTATPITHDYTLVAKGYHNFVDGTCSYCGSSGVAYVDLGMCGESVAWIVTVDGVLKIEGTGPMTEYTSASATPWYDYRSDIRSVVIEKGVTTIGDYAFQGLTNVTSVTIGSSVSVIGRYAFNGMTALGTVTLGDSVTGIEEYAFGACTALTSVSFGKQLKSIGNYAFSQCVSLETAAVPSTVTTLGSGAFKNCAALDYIYLYNGLKTIGSYAFAGTAIEYLTLPSSVTSLGDYVFSNCSALVYVTFAGAGPEISSMAFSGVSIKCHTPAYDSTWTSKVNKNYGGTLSWDIGSGDISASGSGLQWVLDYNGTYTLSGTGEMYNLHSSYQYYDWYDLREKILSVVVEEGVTSIADYAFYGCTNLQSVSIADSVTKIGTSTYSGYGYGRTFGNCTSLTQFTIPKNVKELGYGTFMGCSNLASIDVAYGNSSFSVKDGILYNGSVLHTCPAAKTGEATIYAYTYEIADFAFYKCENLTSITIPSYVDDVGSYAFGYCKNLSQIAFEGDAPYISSDAFYNVEATVTVPASNTTWTPTKMSSYCGTLTWVAGSGSCGTGVQWKLTYSGGNATLTISGSGAMTDYDSSDNKTPWFDHIANIRTVVVEDGVTHVGAYLLSSGSSSTAATKLTSVTLADSVISIGNSAFWYCTSLSTVKWSSKLQSIGNSAFYYAGLSSITLPDSLLTIGSGAFWYCKSLKTVELGSKVTTVEASAFRECTGLQKFVIPASVTTIGNYAFANSTNLKCLEFLGNAPTISTNAFTGVTANAYYLSSRSNWSSSTLKSYGGTLTWGVISQRGNCGSNIEWILDTSGNLYIFGTGAMPSYSATSQAPWYAYRTSIKKVTFRGVTSIGSYAFDGCTALTTVTVPTTISSVGNYAFNGCTGMSTITIPTSVTNVYSNAFAGCTGLEVVMFEGNAPSFGTDAFAGVTAEMWYLSSASRWTASILQNYGGTLTWRSTSNRGSCGTKAWWSLDSAKTLVLVGAGDMPAYSSSYRPWYDVLTQIKSVIIGNKITKITSGAFSGCTALETVTIGTGVTAIETTAFSNCTALTSITFLGNAPSTMGNNMFNGVTATAYYPLNNTTWTTSKKGHYNGTISWVAVCPGHVEASVPAVAPTCTAAGKTEGKYCTVCDEVLVAQEVVPALGHYVIGPNGTSVPADSLEPDCINTSYCTVCKQVAIPAAGHRILGTVYVETDPITITNTSSRPFALTNGTYYSTNTSHSSSSELKFTAQYACTLTLNYGVSSEEDYDKLYILKNGSTQRTISGDVTGQTLTLNLAAGDYVTVRYRKDDSASSGEDRGWVTLTYDWVMAPGIGDVPAETGEPDCTNAVVCRYCQTVIKEALGHRVLQQLPAPFTVDNTSGYPFTLTDGTYYSGNKNVHSSSSTIKFEVTSDCTLDFTYGVSSEANSDKLTISVGSTVKATASGEQSDVTLALTLKAGDTVTVAYTKDSSVHRFDDQAWFSVSYEGEELVSADSVEPGCIDAVVCDVCNEVAKAALGHNVEQWETTQEPTCEENGVKRGECTRCGSTQIGGISATGHTYTSVVTPANCTVAETTTYTCHCGDTYSETNGEALGHDMGQWQTTQEPTCEEAGSKRSDCSRCDHFETEVISALGHNNTAVVTPATCTEAGYTTYTCSVCGNVETEAGEEALGHTGGTLTCTEQAICTRCGEAYGEPAHDFEADVCGVCGLVIISETTFPDANFRAYVETIDGAEDGLLTVDELSEVTDINVRNKNISSLTGIEYFTALTGLSCVRNQLTSLDMSKNPVLGFLSCSNNQLTSLDVSKNPVLEHLECNYNLLTSLDVSQNTALISLDCYHNQLTSLDVSRNTALTSLNCSSNQLTSLDVSQNTALEYLWCSSNQLTSLDVSRNTALTSLNCSSNQLTELNVRRNTALTDLYCGYNQLTSLDLSNITELKGMLCNRNSRTVSVEENQFDLSALAADGFDISKAGDWAGGTVSGSILTATAETVTYTYELGNGQTEIFTLNLEGFCAHSWKDATCTEPQTCELCGLTQGEAKGHSHTAVETAPGCLEDGYITYTCACGDTYTEAGEAALGHTGGSATCKAQAVCSRCGASYGELDPHNHAGDTEIRDAIDATCTKEGYSGDTYCLDCNQQIATGEIVKASGHTMGDWVITDMDSCFKDGVQRRDCVACDQYEEQTIPSQGHNYEDGVCTVCKLPKGLEYTVSNETVIITGYVGTAATVVIPGTIEGYPVTSIGDSAFGNCSDLKSIRIPDGVTRIGGYAFGTGLEEINIPASVTEIGGAAFKNCEGLKDVYIADPNAWCKIAFGSTNWDPVRSAIPTFFAENTHILDENGNEVTELVLDDTVTVIPEYAFKGASIASVTISDSVTEIQFGAFTNCASLKDVHIGAGVTDIRACAFENCSNLESVAIPASVTFIGQDVFNECGKLTNVHITDVGAWANIEYFDMESHPFYWNSRNGGENKLYLNGELVTDLVIPEGVTSISQYAFVGCSGLKSIVIPNSVTRIGYSAFNGCSNLEEMTIPFVGHIPNSEEVSGYHSPFGYFFGIDEYTGGVETRQYTFVFENDNFSDYYIPATLKKVTVTGDRIFDRNFYNCSGLREIVLEDNVAGIDAQAFSFCTGLESVFIGSGITEIGEMAFYDCGSLTDVIIGANVTGIGKQAFGNCSSLTNIHIPGSVTSIGASAFSGCSSLTGIVFEGDAPSFGDNAFFMVNATANYPVGYGTWTSDVMQNYGGRITWVPYEKYIAGGTCGDDLSWNLTESGTLTISGEGAMPDYTTTTMPWYDYIYQIYNVVVESGVSRIGSNAFYGCSGIDKIEFWGDAPEIGENAFFNELAEYNSATTAFYPAENETWTADVMQDYGGNIDWAWRDAEGNCGGACDVDLFWEFESTRGNLTISGTGPMGNFYDNTMADASFTPWRSLRDQIRSIEIEDGVTNIEEETFVDYQNLQQVNIADSVTEIGEYVFGWDSQLKTVRLPNQLTTIGRALFMGCWKLDEILIPNTVTSIGFGAFRECTSLTSVVIPASVANIESDAFGACSGLKEIVFEGDAPSLGECVFQDVTATAYYPVGNKTWTSDVMKDYGGKITWVGLVTSGVCGEELTWNYSAGTLTISGEGDMYDYSQDQTNPAPWTALGGNIKMLVLEEGVTGIGDHAFANCNAIENASFPSTLTRVGEYPFYRFARPDGNVYYRVFWSEVNQTVRQWSQIRFEADSERFLGGDCTDFVENAPITASGKYGDSVYWELNENGTMEFFGSGDMDEFWATGSWLWEQPAKEIVITEGITNIGMNAFESYGQDPLSVSLETVSVAATVRRVEEMAFAGCKALKTITFKGDAPSFGDCCFRDVTATVYYPADNETWTADVMQDYDGQITWVSYTNEHTHNYVDDICTDCGSVKISEITFPDANFRAYVKTLDGAEDGLLTVAELNEVTYIDVSVKRISNLAGIEYFVALKKLVCHNNILKSLDVSKNTALTELNCHENGLTSLDVSKNIALKFLHCDANQLTELDVSKNTALITLGCDHNQLTTLDVSSNTALTILSVYGNRLTSLDVSNNNALAELVCDYNHLTSLDVSNNTALTNIGWTNNSRTVSVEGNQFDLSALAADGFDISKTSKWAGGTVSGNILTATAQTVTYTYDLGLGNGWTATFTLDLEGFCAHSWMDATCTEPQTCELCGLTQGEAKGHSILEVPAVKPTVEAEGNIAHFACEACGRLFADFEGKTELAPEDVILEKVVAMATVNGVAYESLEKALAAAKSGDTVTLTADAVAGTVFIPAGVTLDLAEYSLTVDYFFGVKGAYLTGTPAVGKLIVPKENIVLGQNSYVNAKGQNVLPIWDPAQNCYLFSLFVVNTDTGKGRGLKIDEEKEEIYFQFKHQASGFAITDLLADGASDNEMSVIIRLEWSNEKGTANQEFVYNDTQVGYVSVGKNGVAQDYTFTLTGYSALNIDLSTLKVMAMIVTESGATLVGTIWTQDMLK